MSLAGLMSKQKNPKIEQRKWIGLLKYGILAAILTAVILVFQIKAYYDNRATKLPDIAYCYTISRDLSFNKGFDKYPEFQKVHRLPSRYYKSKNHEEKGGLAPGTLFLWLVICNKGPGPAKYSYLKQVTYWFGEQKTVSDRKGFPPHEYKDEKYYRLPSTINPEETIVLLCEDFILPIWEEKHPDDYIRENMGFDGLRVKTRIRDVYSSPPPAPTKKMSKQDEERELKDNAADDLWPNPDL